MDKKFMGFLSIVVIAMFILSACATGEGVSRGKMEEAEEKTAEIQKVGQAKAEFVKTKSSEYIGKEIVNMGRALATEAEKKEAAWEYVEGAKVKEVYLSGDGSTIIGEKVGTAKIKGVAIKGDGTTLVGEEVVCGDHMCLCDYETPGGSMQCNLDCVPGWETNC